MAVIVRNKNGKEVVLLSPSEKYTKYMDELQNGCKQTNGGRIKYGKNSKPVRLTQQERAWRSGYVSAIVDSSKAFKSKHPNYKAKRKY